MRIPVFSKIGGIVILLKFYPLEWILSVLHCGLVLCQLHVSQMYLSQTLPCLLDLFTGLLFEQRFDILL